MSVVLHTALSRAYNSFLYSPVSEGPDQTPVSVLSTLARQDIDPWDEAARLAEMPKSIAIARLTLMISSANPDSKMQSQAELVATRLVDLLPRPNVLGIPQRDGIPLPQAGIHLRIIAAMAVVVLLIALAVW
jgi:hypothetical protein